MANIRRMTDEQVLALRQRMLEMATTGRDGLRRKAMKMYQYLTAVMLERGL